MLEIVAVGLDLAKNVFQAHGVDVSGRALLRKELRRDQVLEFFGQLPSCTVAMEACGGAHFWGREIGEVERTLDREFWASDCPCSAATAAAPRRCLTSARSRSEDRGPFMLALALS